MYMADPEAINWLPRQLLAPHEPPPSVNESKCFTRYLQSYIIGWAPFAYGEGTTSEHTPYEQCQMIFQLVREDTPFSGSLPDVQGELASMVLLYMAVFTFMQL